MKLPPCVVSVADHAGWTHVVCVAAPDNVPAVVERRKVTTIDMSMPTMPYHHESLTMPVDEADALIERVRQSVTECTTRALRETVSDLSQIYRAVALSIRVPTFPQLPDTVRLVRQSYPLQCAADGMMYQIAWCDAAQALGIKVHQFRRGDEAVTAAKRLDVTPKEIESFVNGAGRPSGPPWTAEHRRAFAAGIAALAPHARGRLEVVRR